MISAPQNAIPERGTAGIPVRYRPPFAVGQPCWRGERPAGDSIFDIVCAVPDLPRNFLTRGVVCVNGETVPRALWSHVRPKPASRDRPVIVTLHYPLGHGGGGGGSSTAKTVTSLVAAFALTIITGGIAAGALETTLGAAFAAGHLGATALSAGVGVAGRIERSAL